MKDLKKSEKESADRFRELEASYQKRERDLKE